MNVFKDIVLFLIGWLLFTKPGEIMLGASVVGYIVWRLIKGDNERPNPDQKSWDAAHKGVADEKAKKDKAAKDLASLVTQNLGIMIAGIFEAVNQIRKKNRGQLIEDLHNFHANGVAEGHAGPNLIQWFSQWMILIYAIAGLAIVMFIITFESSPSLKSTYEWYNPSHPSAGIAYCNPLGEYAQWQHVDPIAQTITPQHEEYYRCHIIETGAKWEDVVVAGQSYHKVVNPDGSFDLFEFIYRWTEKP